MNEAQEQFQQSHDGWQSISPGELLPDGATSWEVQMPNGRLKVQLLDEPGSTEQEDGKVYVLGSPKSIAIKPEALRDAHDYRTLSFTFRSNKPEDLIWMEIRHLPQDTKEPDESVAYETIMHPLDRERTVFANMWWSEVPQQDEKPATAGRDVMATMEDVKNAQVRIVPSLDGGGEV